MYRPHHRQGLGVLLSSVILSACSGGSGGSDQLDANSQDPGATQPATISLAGTAGNPSLTDATLMVQDADGQPLAQTSSDALARFQVAVPDDAKRPLLLTASGGIDLVTGTAPDFEYTALVPQQVDSNIHVSPLSSLMTAMRDCTGLSDDPDTLWATVARELPMGLDSTLNPLTAELTVENAARLMLANELLSEGLRRAKTALENAGTPTPTDHIVRAISCDLGDDGTLNGSATGNVRTVTVFRATEAAVLIESLAAQLIVADQDSNTVLDTALATVLGRSDVSIADIAPDAARVAEARRAISLFIATWPEPELVASATDLSDDPASVATRLAARFDQNRRQALSMLSGNVASADAATLASLEARLQTQSDTPAPVVSFAASDSSVQAGETATLSWAAIDADACQADLGWSGPQPVEGTFVTGPLTASQDFAVTCVGLGGVSRQTLQVAVDGSSAEPRPVITLQAAPQTVAPGTAAKLSWSASNATSCTASGAWSGARATSGSASTGPLTEPATYSLSCSGPGGTESASVPVGIDTVAEPLPSVELNADPLAVGRGDSATLSWASTNAGSCQASGGWSGTKAVSGSESIGPLDATNNYGITCTGPGGSASDSVTVDVAAPAPNPSVTLTADDTRVQSGDTTRLVWSSTDADSCNASGAWSGDRPTSGAEVIGPLTLSSTYTLTCANSVGTAVAMATVVVTGSLSLSWIAPTENADGTPLTDLASYKIYYGPNSRNYVESVTVADPNATSFSFSVLAGTYYMAMTAIDTDGDESEFSNEVLRTTD